MAQAGAGEGQTKKKRISLSLHVGRINSGLTAAALSPGLALPAAVKSVEDHGYTLTFGIKVCTMAFVVLQVQLLGLKSSLPAEPNV